MPQKHFLDVCMFFSEALNPDYLPMTRGLVIQASNPSLLENSVNRELVNVYKWTKANKITVNP